MILQKFEFKKNIIKNQSIQNDENKLFIKNYFKIMNSINHLV